MRTGSYAIDTLDKCASWNNADAPTTQLALEVAADCSITIKPITDLSCSDPGAVSGQTKLVPLTGTYNYTYNDLLIRAYYQTTQRIQMLLPTGVNGARCGVKMD